MQQVILDYKFYRVMNFILKEKLVYHTIKALFDSSRSSGVRIEALAGACRPNIIYDLHHKYRERHRL